jgi:hypothetical protein
MLYDQTKQGKSLGEYYYDYANYFPFVIRPDGWFTVADNTACRQPVFVNVPALELTPVKHCLIGILHEFQIR